MLPSSPMNKRILVVDDDLAILEALTILLHSWNFEVKAVSRAETVFDALEDFHPDLILLDVMLSGMDGRAICKTLKSGPFASIPVIIISAHIATYDIMFDTCAPDDFVPKPFDINYLFHKIEQQLAA